VTSEAAFAEEQIPFPEFTKNQMASLIAYLHGGGPPPEVPMGGGSMEAEQMGGGGDSGGQENMGSESMK
jgi:hypothetical protein